MTSAAALVIGFIQAPALDLLELGDGARFGRRLR
jgi:hypothetical protein